MKLTIPKDVFDNLRSPRVYLCTTGGKIMGELPAYECNLHSKWNAYSEFSFSIDRQYTDVLTGGTHTHPLFDKAEGLRLVLVEAVGYFIIQDPDTNYADKDTKTLSCFSLEYATGSKYLENFYINTGSEDSKEVIYHSSFYASNYTLDDMYERATSSFDPYEKYYIRDYTNATSYTYTQVEISDATVYASYDGSTVAKTLYIHKYPNVRFYWPSQPQLSLLHLIFEKIPEWSIGSVDATLWRKERKFEEERIAIYDFLTNTVCDTFQCVVEWDTLTRTVNIYEEADSGILEDGTVQDRFKTDVYISRENLANEIHVQYSTDDIKTKLTVAGADNLDIREVNLGKNSIMNLDYYANSDWMDVGLLGAYSNYLEAVKVYTPQYTSTMQNWVSAYNKYNDLIHAVPAEGNVVLVGDEFQKLYCVYTPLDNAYYDDIITDTDIDELVVENLYSDHNYTRFISKDNLKDGTVFSVQGYCFKYVKSAENFKCFEAMTDYNLRVLAGDQDNGYKSSKLMLYHVNEDTEANNNDNILLKLRNANSDIATIRIYNDGAEDAPEYFIQSIIVSASSGVPSTPQTYTMREWINGELTAQKMALEGYTINYIGIMGAYFVLAKDETQEATLEEYGINLLRAKHDTYVTIFQTQTEAMFSQEGYRCIVQNEQPDGDYEDGTRWLDTNSNPVVLKEYDGETWYVINEEVSDIDQSNIGNYQRYIDNYDKMVAVQQMLLKKQEEAEYYSDGYAVADIVIDPTAITSDEQFFNVAQKHFGDSYSITRVGFDIALTPIYTFQTSFDEVTYVEATTFDATQTYYRQVAQYYNGDGMQVTADTEGAIEITSYWVVDIANQEAFDTYGGVLYIRATGHVFAVYLRGNTPYVAYADSQGVYQAMLNAIAQKTELEVFFNRDQWVALSPLIREDEYSDDNFLLTGYESETERLTICEELMAAATKELKKLSQPSLEFSMTMANILALPEFQPLMSQFALGNFIRVELRPGVVKKARLLEINLNFDDLSDFDATFGNLVTTKSEVDLHAELLKQAVTAGKQVATAAGNWQSAFDKANKLEEAIVGGLQDITLQVGRASGQAISWDKNGALYFRKFQDGSTDQYQDEQIAVINNKIVFTNDGWKTSKAALGEFEVDTNGDGIKEKMYGLLADAVVSGYISGSTIEGGSLKIGDGTKNYFHVSEDGSVSIYQAGQEKYATTQVVDIIKDGRRFSTELAYTGSTIFSEPGTECTITCKIYDWEQDITQDVLDIGGTFSWIRNSISTSDTTWNNNHANRSTNTITITNEDIIKNSHFECEVQFNPNKLSYVTVETWNENDKDSDKIYYAQDTLLYYYYANDMWNSTDDARTAGLPSSIVNIQTETNDEEET